jgi:hypothetical protein
MNKIMRILTMNEDNKNLTTEKHKEKFTVKKAFT